MGAKRYSCQIRLVPTYILPAKEIRLLGIIDGVVVVEQVGIGGDAKHFIFERLDDDHVGFASCAS